MRLSLLTAFLMTMLLFSGCATPSERTVEAPELPEFDHRLSDHQVLGEIVWINKDEGQVVVLLDGPLPSNLGDFLVAHDGAFSLTGILTPGGPRTDHSLGLRIQRGRPEVGNEVIVPGAYLRKVLNRD